MILNFTFPFGEGLTAGVFALAAGFEANALLPPTLADFVLDESDRMPCAPDYVAAALIVCLGAVVGARCAP